MAGSTTGITFARSLLSADLHPPCPTAPHRQPEPEVDLQLAVARLCPGHPAVSPRSALCGRPDWDGGRLAYLDSQPRLPSPRALPRSGWRLGCRETKLAPGSP